MMGIEYTKNEQHAKTAPLPQDASAFESELTALRDMHRILLAFDNEARARMLSYLVASYSTER